MGRPREFDADAALAAALVTFWERGYAMTSIGDLVEAMGVSRSSLYATWGDKDGVFAAVLDRYDDQFVSLVLGPIEAADAGLDAIERTLTGLASMAEHAPGAFGCLVAHSGSERARIDEATARRVAANQRRMETGFDNALRNAGAAVRADVDPTDAAAMLTVFARGLVTQVRAGASSEHLQASTRAILSLIRSPQETP